MKTSADNYLPQPKHCRPHPPTSFCTCRPIAPMLKWQLSSKQPPHSEHKNDRYPLSEVPASTYLQSFSILPITTSSCCTNFPPSSRPPTPTFKLPSSSLPYPIQNSSSIHPTNYTRPISTQLSLPPHLHPAFPRLCPRVYNRLRRAGPTRRSYSTLQIPIIMHHHHTLSTHPQSFTRR